MEIKFIEQNYQDYIYLLNVNLFKQKSPCENFYGALWVLPHALQKLNPVVVKNKQMNSSPLKKKKEEKTMHFLSIKIQDSQLDHMVIVHRYYKQQTFKTTR